MTIRRRILLLTMPIFLLAGFFIWGARVSPVQAATITIDANTIWTKAQSPIVVRNYIWLKAGVNLTIEPGVIVKFNSGGMLIVSGKLTALGTKAEHIVFTSLKDDSFGGDTNADGAATSPAPGDWWYLNIINLGGEANLDYVTIQYGGEYSQGGVRNYKGKLTINNSLITKNDAGIANSGGQLAINNSSIFNNLAPFGSVLLDWGVSNNNQANVVVDAKNNWWGIADGPCPWRQLLPPGVPIWQVDIKAICGDKPLVDSGVIYSPWLAASPDEPAKPDPVIIVPGIMGSWRVSGKWELDPILHTYDNLWQALKNAGYEEGKTLFALPYQWRLSNSYTAELLKQKIQEIKALTGRDKVDIIAHSMGGLIARSYIEGSGYQNDIDQLIFLATPHQGSTKAYLMWEGGELGQTARDFIFERILTVEADFNGYGSLFSYIKNLPMQSVQELLPIYDYLRDKDTMTLRTYPNNYPVNTFLELLNNPFELQKLNGVRMTNILADAGASSTIENLRVINKEFANGEWVNGYPENYSLPFTDHGLEYGLGDGTVPSKSNKDFASLENIIINSNHADIVTDTQKMVIKELTDVEPVQEVRLNMFKKFFLVRIFSPADFVITAPDGQRLGKDFLSGQAVNEIAGAFYSGFDSDIEFAVIPDPQDGNYEIEVQGVANGGEYTLASSIIDNNAEISQEYNGNIAPAQQQNFTTTYSAASDNPLSDLEPIDTIAPVVVINKPTADEQYLHSDNLVIDYTATDDFSGLATTTITIDGQTIATTTIDLFDYVLGMHSLTITAIDKAGNQAQAQVNFSIIANIESTISDINEIHNRGWLKDKSYQVLLKKTFKLLKIETKYFDKEQRLIEKLREKTQADSKLTDEQKQKIIKWYDKKLADLKKNRTKAINKSLDLIIKLLNKAKDKNQINQQGYDIILSDVNYLRGNL